MKQSELNKLDRMKKIEQMRKSSFNNETLIEMYVDLYEAINNLISKNQPAKNKDEGE